MYEIRKFEKIERKRPSKLKNILRIVLFFALMTFTLNVLTNSYLDKKSKHDELFISPLTTVKEVVKKTTSYFNSQENSKKLDEIVDKILGKQKDNYGIVIKNLDTGERYYLNENKKYETASLYKLWVMATVYKTIKEGKLSEEDVLTQDIAVLNNKFNIASEAAELTEGEISLPVENLLSRMIIISDNYSALLLSERVKISNVYLFLTENGFLESKVGTADENPISSSYDIGLFFEKLYKGEIIDTNYSIKMLDLLKKQQLNGKLPKYLPEDVVIAHKTGELGKISHDVGIVYTDKSNYIIVIMSKTDSPLDANENIANISKEVFGYFGNR